MFCLAYNENHNFLLMFWSRDNHLSSERKLFEFIRHVFYLENCRLIIIRELRTIEVTMSLTSEIILSTVAKKFIFKFPDQLRLLGSVKCWT